MRKRGLSQCFPDGAERATSIAGYVCHFLNSKCGARAGLENVSPSVSFSADCSVYHRLRDATPSASNDANHY
jgi:hypothetical protein